MRFFNCIGIGHEFINENGKNKAPKNKGTQDCFRGRRYSYMYKIVQAQMCTGLPM